MAQDTSGGTVTLTVPKQVLATASAAPGDRGQFEVSGPDTIRIKVVHRAETCEPPAIGRAARTDQPGGATPTQQDQPPESAPSYAGLRTLPLREMLGRYRIDGPIDVEVDREAWHDEAAKDIFGKRPDRFPS